MKLTVLNSGSSGNCYLLEIENEILILDLGVSLKEVKKELNFDLSKIVGCYVSHFHNDHSKFRKEYEPLGVDIFAPYDGNKNRVNAQIGGFTLQAFSVPHGDTPNWGLLGKHKNGESFIYITDYSYTQYLFSGYRINHFLVECNWQTKYVDVTSENFRHKIADHCSLETCKKFIEANLTDNTQSVILCHLGQESTDPKECVEEIEKVVKSYVFVDYARPKTTYVLGGKK